MDSAVSSPSPFLGAHERAYVLFIAKIIHSIHTPDPLITQYSLR
jgi:hypothetical protein